MTEISFKSFKISDVKKTNYLNWLRDKDVVKFLYRKELLTTISEKNYKYVLNLIKSKNDFFYLIILIIFR